MGKHTRRKVDPTALAQAMGTWSSARLQYTKPSPWAWLTKWVRSIARVER